LSFTILNCQQARKRIGTDHEFTLFRRGNELQGTTENPPWLNPKPTFNFELAQHKKSETNPLLIQQHFAEIRSVTSEYSAIYTDGSKDSDRVASAAVFGQQVYSARIPSASSIFSAEANAILLALKFVASSEKSKFMICSNSLSCLLAIENCKTQNPIILKIVEIYKSLVAKLPYDHVTTALNRIIKINRNTNIVNCMAIHRKSILIISGLCI
jgi:hypothetical protein